MYTPKKKRRRSIRIWGGQLLRTGCLLSFLFSIGMCASLVIVATVPLTYKIPWEHFPPAATATLRFFLMPKFGPNSVLLDEKTLAIAEAQGASQEVVGAIIAAARSVGIADHHLLGLAAVETSYCTNLGGGIAIDEVRARGTSGWWGSNAKALEKIAKALGIKVTKIKGSVGAGAISCFQLMPINWIRYALGDPHYTNHWVAALAAARFLKDHGYANDPEAAILSYNRGAGQAYVNSVINASKAWEDKTSGVTMLPAVEPNTATIIATFFRYVAYYMQGGKGGVVIPEGDFLNPYPGGNVCSSGNNYGDVFGSYVHYGVDLCRGSKVVAPQSCRVTVSKFIDRNTKEAGTTWSASGYTVVCEGELLDGRKIEWILAHLQKNTMPPIGTVFNAGDYIATTGCSGDVREWCSGTHLHLGVKIDGQWVNPLDLINIGGTP